eukprot:1032280-Pleurochrysis_carterae.AAC.1
MRRSTGFFASQLSGSAGICLLGAAGSAMRSPHEAAFDNRSTSDSLARSRHGLHATMSFASRAVRSLASVRYVRYPWATVRPGVVTYPTCMTQNTLALARSQAADSRCPLLIAKQAEISRRSAASAKFEQCGFDHR